MGRGRFKKRNTGEVKMDEFVENIEESVVGFNEPAAVEVEEPEIIEIEDSVVEPVVEEPVKEKTSLFKVQVVHNSLRRRAAPSFGGATLGTITDNGIYSIYQESDGWGQLEDGSWIKLDFTRTLTD